MNRRAYYVLIVLVAITLTAVVSFIFREWIFSKPEDIIKPKNIIQKKKKMEEDNKVSLDQDINKGSYSLCPYSNKIFVKDTLLGSTKLREEIEAKLVKDNAENIVSSLFTVKRPEYASEEENSFNIYYEDIGKLATNLTGILEINYPNNNIKSYQLTLKKFIIGYYKDNATKTEDLHNLTFLIDYNETDAMDDKYSVSLPIENGKEETPYKKKLTHGDNFKYIVYDEENKGPIVLRRLFYYIITIGNRISNVMWTVVRKVESYLNRDESEIISDEIESTEISILDLDSILRGIASALPLKDDSKNREKLSSLENILLMFNLLGKSENPFFLSSLTYDIKEKLQES